MAFVQARPSRVLGRDRLSRLPMKLVLRITRDLTTTELCAVRSCSRALERALRHFFAHELFRRKQFMFTDFSLQTLLAIAQHPLLSQTLRHVSFGLEEFVVIRQVPPEGEKQSVDLVLAAAQQKALLANGRALQLLAAALSLLPNLETVQLRDYPSYTRFRDGPLEAWSSYGVWRTRKQVGDDAGRFLKKSFDPDFTSQAFLLVMAALAQSNARPANIEVLIHSKWAGLKDFAFDLSPMPRLNLPGVSAGNGADVDTLAILAGLRRVHLKLQFLFDQSGVGPLDLDDNPMFSQFQQAVVEALPIYVWLAHCPNIRWLRLNLHMTVRPYNNVFLGQLGEPLPAYYPLPAGSTASREIPLPFASHLRRLDLGVACCKRVVLENLLNHFPALEHLSLFRFSLTYDQPDENPDLIWHNFLDALAESPLGRQLTQLTLIKLGIVVHTDNFKCGHKTHLVLFYEDYADAYYVAEPGTSLLSWLHTLPMYIEPTHNSEDEDADADFDDPGSESDIYSDFMSDKLDESDFDDEDGEEDKS
ncbi:hypothetical protein SEPCBS119000_004842 [Sporothrix epigloea]|uniref:F-box domain-containing protein n=1 Tax=Sporothrix epigloea TaxID=1892477 RepID=A0ABP0DUC4_9PEZI